MTWDSVPVTVMSASAPATDGSQALTIALPVPQPAAGTYTVRVFRVSDKGITDSPQSADVFHVTIGAAGPEGLQGPQGIQGPQGVPGPPGPAMLAPVLEVRDRGSNTMLPFGDYAGNPNLSVVGIDLPAGRFVVTFGVWLKNGANYLGQDNTRDAACWPTGSNSFGLDGISLMLHGDEDRTASWTTTRGNPTAPSRLDIYCSAGWGTVGNASDVRVCEAKIDPGAVGQRAKRRCNGFRVRHRAHPGRTRSRSSGAPYNTGTIPLGR